MSLKELRQEWEQGLNCFFEKEIRGIVYVLLKDANGLYHFHRYWQTIKDYWTVSADVQAAEAEDTMKDIILLLSC